MNVSLPGFVLSFRPPICNLNRRSASQLKGGSGSPSDFLTLHVLTLVNEPGGALRAALGHMESRLPLA